MFITALFIIVKKWKQHKCLSTDEWINKTLYNHTTFLESTRKGMKDWHILQHEWILKILNARGQPWQYLTLYDSIYSNIQKRPIYTDGKQTSGWLGWRIRNKEWLIMGLHWCVKMIEDWLWSWLYNFVL